jgi:hypothetical protein
MRPCTGVAADQLFGLPYERSIAYLRTYRILQTSCPYTIQLQPNFGHHGGQ